MRARIRIPLIVAGSGIHRNLVINDQASLIDLAPTILDLLGVSRDINFIGNSLVPLIRGEAKKSLDYVISERLDHVFSCRTPRWKLITDMKARIELYNIEDDPEEKANLATEYST